MFYDHITFHHSRCITLPDKNTHLTVDVAATLSAIRPDVRFRQHESTKDTVILTTVYLM